ncbi:MAG: hypothetical protein SW019_22415 [Actinomycetota bacterium]|nr:hypothetical protein [Actinomycetota bacterium]
MNIAQTPPFRGARLLVVALFAVLVAALAACTGVEPSPGSTSSSSPLPSSPFDPTTTPLPEPTGPLLAYRAADEIGLVDGTTVIATASGTFTPSNDLITTEDGRYVFARTTDDQLATLEVASGKSATRPVPTGPAVGTGGESTVVWFEQPNRLMRLDLADPDSQPTIAQIVELPTVPGTRPGEARLVVARGGTAVIARTETPPSPFGGPDTLYAVRGPGAPTSLGQVEANSPVSVARLSADGARLAYAMYRATDNECGTAAVVLTAADGSQQTYDVASSDAQAGSRVPKLWWPTEGLPQLSLMTWRCDRTEAYPPLVWQLSDDGMTQVEPRAAAIQIADVAPAQRALVLPQDGEYTEPAGALVLEESDRRIPIKSGVDAIAVIAPSP